ncbi:MAG: PSD1 and planctomycete cytochrome C domain-containing protein [Gemmatales bacterium]|nr:PSD1 and planctomycete cytochrome C domain-containing protein [Gemmatales bacterium]MDW8387824.1 PSD1 and planctomycete cytochrome C domain-containing protein [Gemmatales bacterium]
MRPGRTLGMCLFSVLSVTLSVSAQEVEYQRDVKPILARCCSCHGALRQKFGLRLDTAELIRKGGKSGPAIFPGDPDGSLLIQAVIGEERSRMPPEGEGKPLTRDEIEILKRWIQQGAKAPPEPTPPDPKSHWAFVRPRPTPLPEPPPGWRVHNPIDIWIAVQDSAAGQAQAPEADKPTLLRRVYLDLIGLPPTREELHAFLADDSPDAYERVVDRLLADPRYGERWARHWMDVWRYSDWYGRRQVPDVWNSAPQIWRWRDWIVRSLNEDKGYDRMVQEMLAADEICPEDDSAVVATGFLVRNWYALNPHQWLRDCVEHTGKAFLGLTLNCAHCHDHKYDPISQEEYFRFRAFFEPLQLRQDRVPDEPDPGPFQKYEYSVVRRVQRFGLIRVFDERLDAQTFMYHGGDERNRMQGRPPVTPAAPAFLGGDRLTIQTISLPPSAWYPGLKLFLRREELARAEAELAAAGKALQDAESALRLAREWLGAVESQPEADLPQPPPRFLDARQAARTTARQAAHQLEKAQLTLGWKQASRQALEARIAADDAKISSHPDADRLARAAAKAERLANYHAARVALLDAELIGKSDQIAAAQKALSAAEQALNQETTQYSPLSPVYPSQSSGRRKALAQWITSPENPLTARVAVNHIWMRHFGEPLVPTVYDFGRNGKPPSHPQLLDWLALELMHGAQDEGGLNATGAASVGGWKMKRLHRLIVTSAVYRQASWNRPPRRLEAEAIRDSILYLAGVLDQRMGGQELETDQDGKTTRRSLYYAIYPEDGGHLPILSMFDPPDPCDCYRRSETVVPQQALALTNSDLLVRSARKVAERLASITDPREFILAAFETVLARPADAEEIAVCLDFLARQEAVYPEGSQRRERARESLIRVLFNHNDFVTVR